MAGLESFEEMMEKLHGVYTSEQFSDVTISVTETDDVVQSNSGDRLFTNIKAHSIILIVNSEYFKNALETMKNEDDMVLQVRVKHGEGRLFRLMVSSFYNRKVLDTADIVDLLAILEMGSIYANGPFNVYVLKLIDNIELDYNSSTSVLKQLGDLDNKVVKDNDITTKLKTKCANLLVKYFFPIEEMSQKRYEEFLELDFYSFEGMVQSDEMLCFVETSLLLFMIEWLQYDPSRQTSDYIKRLLENVRVPGLHIPFLHSTIAINHVTLNKWNGFTGWIFNCVSYLGLSPAERVLNNPKFHSQKSRSVGLQSRFNNNIESSQIKQDGLDNIQGRHRDNRRNRYATQHPKLRAIRWMVHMTPEKADEQFGPTRHLCVHDGVKYSPQSIDVSPVQGDGTQFKMTLSIKCFGVVNDVSFVVGIVPANREYDEAKQSFHSAFAESFLIWTPPVSFKSDSHIFDFWFTDRSFLDIANDHGLYACLLPITSPEMSQYQPYQNGCKQYVQPDRYYLGHTTKYDAYSEPAAAGRREYYQETSATIITLKGSTNFSI